MIIAPSVLSMDYTKMIHQIQEIEQSNAKWLHLDIMDGHFVPNLSFGPDIVSQLRKHSKLFFDVHIMVSDPEFFAPIFIDAGADLITFHIEATKNPKALIESIKAKGRKVGISLKPQTPVESIFPYLYDVDLVLVMSVEPGFGGQSFMEESLPKIEAIKSELRKVNSKALIEIDGGINATTAKLCLNAGVDVLVAGSYIFKGNIQENIQTLWKL
jgi:ribulose-phosphate 3-epimerase